jgi:hypothetical protein
LKNLISRSAVFLVTLQGVIATSFTAASADVRRARGEFPPPQSYSLVLKDQKAAAPLPQHSAEQDFKINYAKLLAATNAADQLRWEIGGDGVYRRVYAMKSVGEMRDGQADGGSQVDVKVVKTGVAIRRNGSVYIEETSPGAEYYFTWASHGARRTGPPDEAYSDRNLDGIPEYNGAGQYSGSRNRSGQKSGALVLKVSDRFFINILEGGNLFYDLCGALWFGSGVNYKIAEGVTLVAGFYKNISDDKDHSCRGNMLGNGFGAGVSIHISF